MKLDADVGARLLASLALVAGPGLFADSGMTFGQVEETPLIGSWVSTDSRDPIAVASIAGPREHPRLQLVMRCEARECAWPPLPLTVFASGGPSSLRGLAMWAGRESIAHVTLRHDAGALLVEWFDISAKRYTRAHLRRSSPAGFTRDLSRLNPIALAASLAFLKEFGEIVESPSIHESAPDARCGVQAGATATAYLPISPTRARLLTVRLSTTGEVLRRASTTVITPRGRIRVLAALIDYRETLGDNGEALWRRGQAAINEDHAAFARAHGRAAPIVLFENTTVALPREAVASPQSRRDVRTALRARGVNLEAFDVLMTINLDPRQPAGGQAYREDLALIVGNYSRWTTPLTERDWVLVARTAYHHELGHLWGWDHDWSACAPRDAFGPFITAPVLFGWTDTDGDSIPEIDDPTPYGRITPSTRIRNPE